MSTEGQPWYFYMDEAITEEMLNNMVDDFLSAYSRCNQSGLKRQIALLQPAKPSPSDSGYKSQNDEVVHSPTKRKALSNVYRPRKKRKLNA